jgi:hypothetical protein
VILLSQRSAKHGGETRTGLGEERALIYLQNLLGQLTDQVQPPIQPLRIPALGRGGWGRNATAQDRYGLVFAIGWG